MDFYTTTMARACYSHARRFLSYAVAERGNSKRSRVIAYYLRRAAEERRRALLIIAGAR